MPNIPFIAPLRTPVSNSLRPRHLNREEERLVRYYRSLPPQDREAARCLLFAVFAVKKSNPTDPHQ
jgi:hypothetical protein